MRSRRKAGAVHPQVRPWEMEELIDRNGCDHFAGGENRYLIEPCLRLGTRWVDLVAGVRRDVAEMIKRDGACIMSERHGLFTCC